MIEYEQFCFAAPPRTASLWFRTAARICGLTELNVDDGYHTFGITGKLKVSIVRHPFDWLCSCYSSLQAGTLDPDNIVAIGELNYQSTLEVFLYDYLAMCPGHIKKLFDFYQANSVMRVEDLPGAFLELATTLGVDRKWRYVICDLPALNCSAYNSYDLPKGMLEAVVKAEKELCETYDYW